MGIVVLSAAALPLGCVSAQPATETGVPAQASATSKTGALIAPRDVQPSGRGAAYDRLGMFPSKSSLPYVESWLGRPLNYYSVFAGKASPEMMLSNTRKNVLNADLVQSVKGRAKLCYQIPVAFGPANAKKDEDIPAVRAQLQQTIDGAYDDDYRATAQVLVDAGFGDAIIRVGHEFSGRWYPWSAVNNGDAYAAAFRHVVTIFRAVSPQFTFDFNGSNQGFGQWAQAAYPGNDYVDIIGVDIYDRALPKNYYDAGKKGWGNSQQAWDKEFLPRLETMRKFAVEKGKLISIPEWGIEGVTDKESNGIEGRMTVGGDDPTFIHNMAKWMNSLPKSGPGSLAYHSYFWANMTTEGPHTLDKLPASAAAFLQEFGDPGKSEGFVAAKMPPPETPPATP